MEQNNNICPICHSPNDKTLVFCNQCGWEFRYFLTPLSKDFLEIEKQRMEIAQKIWDNLSKNKKKELFSYGFLVTYQGQECISNMILIDDPIETVKEWPVGKFVTQYDGQSNITLHIYRNKSNQKIVPLQLCEKIMSAVISLDETAIKGTPILVKWEREKDSTIFITVSCLNKKTIIRI
ncbi:MAG: hypothetical protein IJD84_06675 [Parabacteroides sp.]|nr:hypothetical protein [Parabacteroides sp.]